MVLPYRVGVLNGICFARRHLADCTKYFRSLLSVILMIFLNTGHLHLSITVVRRKCRPRSTEKLWKQRPARLPMLCSKTPFVRYAKRVCCVPGRWVEVDARLRVRLRVRKRLRKFLRGIGAPFALGTLEKQLAQET